ncbi:MAG: polysaccharide deacetylase family protein [Eubacterium sp.]
MKKLFSAVLILCAVFLVGCTQNTQPNTTTNNTTGNISTTKEETTDGMDTTTPTAKGMAGINDLSKSKVVWGPGIITDHQQPADPVDLQRTFGDLGARWLLDDQKSICLTFDEGYENGFTPAILDTLKEKKVKAVFFVTYDFARDNADLIRRMIDEGHIVGNHTYRHYTMDEVSLDEAKEEVVYLHNYMKEKYNYTMSYFRFPKGEFSQQSLYLVHSLGYKSVFWSYAYADWDPDNQPDEEYTLSGILDSTHPGEIMLLHAVSSTNADILGRVIDGCREQGYSFTTDIG